MSDLSETQLIGLNDLLKPGTPNDYATNLIKESINKFNKEYIASVKQHLSNYAQQNINMNLDNIQTRFPVDFVIAMSSAGENANVREVLNQVIDNIIDEDSVADNVIFYKGPKDALTEYIYLLIDTSTYGYVRKINTLRTKTKNEFVAKLIDNEDKVRQNIISNIGKASKVDYNQIQQGGRKNTMMSAGRYGNVYSHQNQLGIQLDSRTNFHPTWN